MKTIITLDKANQPYGFPQLNADGNLNTSGSFSGLFTGDVTISNILTLTPQDPLPSGVATGSFAVSSSVPSKPYFYDGTTWNALY